MVIHAHRTKQEGQDGPGLLTWIFERTITNVLGQFQRRILFYVRIVKLAPIHQSHVYRRIKISQTIFQQEHPRNIPVKLIQNLTSSFRGDFFRISSCMRYSASSPHSPEPCFLKNFFMYVYCK